VNQLSITAGIFFVSLLGSYVFVEEDQGQVFSEWRDLAWFGFAVSLLLLGMLCMPESPQWLAKRGDLEGAKAALRRLRTGDVTAEERALETTPAAAAGSEDAVPAQAATSLGYYSRSLVVGVGLFLFQQFSGANAIMMYTTKICQEAGVPNAQLAAMGSMAAQVALTAVACTLVERAGRRPLLLFATTTMCISHLLLSYYYVASSHGLWAPSWLAILALAVFIVGFSLGMGPIPWLILAEIFPTEVRGTASSIATAVNWGSSFLVCLFFQPLEEALTRQGCFFLFAMVCLACFIFVKLLVPETKGKTVDEVLATMNSKRRGVRDISMADTATH
jgi:SP family facilitated glucose transporter-like MFS transporter 8